VYTDPTFKRYEGSLNSWGLTEIEVMSGEERTMLFTDKVQMKAKLLRLLIPSQEVIDESLETRSVWFLNTEMRFWAFKITIGTPVEDETMKFFHRTPQPFRKLHSWTFSE
jgi:hypothetical protein